PVPSPQTNTGIDINQALYDTLGRLYRFGIRYNFLSWDAGRTDRVTSVSRPPVAAGTVMGK
ncbi:MAG: hypothetical protein ACRYFW_03630, partial [Janthinobacterium lividum]